MKNGSLNKSTIEEQESAPRAVTEGYLPEQWMEKVVDE